MTEPVPLTSEELAAERALSRAMMRLGGEPPSQVYTEDGYVIWVRSVAKEVTEPYRSAVAALTAEKERLERLVAMWAAERCDDVLAHGQEHNAHGAALGYCLVCGMAWPCPCAVVAECQGG